MQQVQARHQANRYRPEIRVDYVNYGALRKKWKRAEANELRKLCNEEGIVVEAGLSAAALLEKLDEHYKGDDSDDK